MKRTLYIVAGSPLSDIGKGWLAGSIASTIPSSYLIKVDPLLNPVDLSKCDLTQGLNKMTDAQTYDQLGVSFNSEQLFLHGNVLLEFLEKHKTSEADTHTSPRLTFGDVAYFFAQKIADSFKASSESHLVIEVGGAVIDPELSYLPAAFKLVAAQLDLKAKIILLSYLDYSEDSNLSQPIKTRHITHAIEQTRYAYGEPHAVFFRRRNLPKDIENVIPDLTESIAKRAVYPKEKIIYLPNFESPLQEREFISGLVQKAVL